MKKEEAVANEGHSLVLYVEAEDHTYGPVQTGSFMARNYLDDFFEKRARLEAESRERVRRGEISPVAYYMLLIDIGEADLAARVGVSRRALRRHLQPAGFASLDIATAARYAEVFGVPVANLFQIMEPVSGGLRIRQERTASPLVVLARAEQERP